MTEDRQCLECGDKILGRMDKRFCNDSCRNTYNNRLNKDTTNYIRNINNRLRKNYRILSGLNPDGKSKTTRNQLRSLNFDFDYITSVYTTKVGKVCYFVYDQGYLPLDNDYFALVKKDN